MLERNISAPRYLKRKSISLGLTCLPITIFIAYVLFSNKFDSLEELGLSISYLALMSFSAYSGVCANHLLILRRTGTLGLVSLSCSGLGFALIVIYFFTNGLTLSTVLLTNCTIQLLNTILLAVLSQKLVQNQRPIGTAPQTELRNFSTLSSRRFPWMASSLDVIFSRIDVLFLSVISSTQFLGLYSIPSILVGVCYSMFSIISAAGFNSSKVGNAETKLKVSVQINIFLGVALFAIAGVLFPILLVPIFGDKFSNSEGLLPIAFGFGVFLSIAVPLIQYLLIKRVGITPVIGLPSICVGLTILIFYLSENPVLSATTLAWTLTTSMISLAYKHQRNLFSLTSRRDFINFLKAE